jgi:hypothetical protein
MKPEIQDFLYQISRSPQATPAAIADNCRFDERVAPERWDKFIDRLEDADKPTWQDWAETNQLAYENDVVVPSLSIPDSFLKINHKAWLSAIATNRDVVRLEHLQYPLDKTNLSFETLQELLANKTKPDFKERLENFIKQWNNFRDARPAFATFYDGVQSEADADDWQHQLRDRLGLGHYSSDKGVAIPVALMRYSLDEVLKTVKRKAIPNGFALPTVLDGGMHEFFFPVPQSHPYGATLHLDPNQAETLTAELLHYRLEYQVKHLLKIGLITRPHNVQDKRLREARDLHLLALQEATSRPDFGELMEGRT